METRTGKHDDGGRWDIASLVGGPLWARRRSQVMQRGDGRIRNTEVANPLHIIHAGCSQSDDALSKEQPGQ